MIQRPLAAARNGIGERDPVPPVVRFFLPGETDLDRLRSLDPDQDWRDLIRGEHSWILQTFLRLNRAGHPVELVAEPCGPGLVVYHAKHGRALMRHARRLREAVLVGVRADLREPLTADFQVLQNRVWVDDRRLFFVPLWPQPHLLPREPSRGTGVTRIAFKGFASNLHPDFLDPRWNEELAQRGIEWEFDATGYEGNATAAALLNWCDYRDVDLVLAVRPADPGGHRCKPATKLYNAWAAGVPALLGAEPAFRELRESELDYFEVGSMGDALAAIDRLRAVPELYRAMAEHGRARARAFAPEAIVASWVDLLWGRIPAVAGERPLQTVPHRLRPLVRRVQRVLQGRPAR